jgi:FAD/FMN-containing dehydrogenase
LKFEIDDASGFKGYADAIHTPSDEAQLRAILFRVAEERIPVTVLGAGTGVTGGRVPLDGHAISTERFRRLDIGPGHAVVGAGVLLRDIQAAASRTGQFYPPDPTEISASIGGTIATNASGSRSFRFGATRAHTLGLRVALAGGEVLDLWRGQTVPFEVGRLPRANTTKFTAGFPLEPGMDYMDLFIGSEGTLGVVYEATVRLLPAPEELLSGVVFLPSDDAALAAVETWRRVFGLRMFEYMDAGSLDLLRPKFDGIPREARAALLIEQDQLADADLEEWQFRLEQAGALVEASWFGIEAADRERFRVFRHALPEAVNDTVRRRGMMKLHTDFAVPLERNLEMLAVYREVLGREFPGQYVLFGHIGDAHVHANILPENEDQANRGREVITEIARQAVALGGTVSAEHGLGKRKAHLLELQYSPAEIEELRKVKRRLDPLWLLGRGTLLSEPG